MHAEEVEHGLHVYEGLSDVPVDRAQEVEWDGQLEQQPIHHHQVTHSHGTWGKGEGEGQEGRWKESDGSEGSTHWTHLARCPD